MHVLLSGATGYLGRHLLARWLADGHRVTALVRGGERARLLAALAPFALPPTLTEPARLRVVACDLTTAADELARALRSDAPAAFVHAAGLTRFDAHLAAELDAHNLRGTQVAWTLACALGIPVFHHLSTAYVAGCARTRFGATEFDVGQRFNNPYEASKFAAERWLRDAAVAGAPRLVVHRPSIVVGGHPIGADQSVSTLYTFMKAVQFLRAYALRDGPRGDGTPLPRDARSDDYCHVPVRVAADPASTVNLVAIEDVVDGLDEALGAAPAVGAVETRQLTGHDYRIDDIERAITTTLRVSGVRLVEATAFDSSPRSALEAQFHRITRVYAPYLFASPCFAPRPTARRVDPVQLTRDYLAQDTGRRAAKRRTREASQLAGLALGALGITQARDYFAALCDGAVGRDFLARHDYVDATVGFRLRGSAPCEVTLHFDRGRVTPADARNVDCRYELDAELFMRIVHGETDLRAAFLAGKVRITGNVELALKFGALLGFYYGRLDEHLVEELSA